MSERKVKEIIANTFMEIADGLETGTFGRKPIIGIAIDGSEHGEDVVKEVRSLAKRRGLEILILEGDSAHEEMERKLADGSIDGAVTMHYPFPIGVSTVGKIVTPAAGKPMYLATTTGTSHTDRVAAMVRNAVYGIIAAKADGVDGPTIGIANINGARQCERALRKLEEGGYPINFAESSRADGGAVMRGNDLLQGSADVMVMDPLTGNLMVKIFSAYTTGGNYESLGWGYGPGVGEDFDKIIMIVSRASGAPLITSAVEYAISLINNDFYRVVAEEMKKAKDAGLEQIIEEITENKTGQEEKKPLKMPEKEVVTAQIPGIEIMDLEDAVAALWEENIYAESGMGCTGPIIRISEKNHDKAKQILAEKKFV